MTGYDVIIFTPGTLADENGNERAGARELLRRLRIGGYPTAAVTDGDELKGLGEAIQTRVDLTQEFGRIPLDDAIYRAFDTYGADAERCLTVVSAKKARAAAKSAGTDCIGVVCAGDGEGEVPDLEALADHILAKPFMQSRIR